jgi:hypothetical protein
MTKDTDLNGMPNAAPGDAARTGVARPGVVTLRCPNCGGTVTVRAPGKSLAVVCQSCNSVLDLQGTDVANIVKYEQPRIPPKIPIGTRGTFRGQVLECIGFMVKEEEGYRWQEYLLFNPRIGFRWLVYDAGHWNFCTPIPAAPLSGGRAFATDRFVFEGRQFQRYHIGKSSVALVEGEFYWRVRIGDIASGYDFVAPPFMLSMEKSEDEIIWTRLEYIEPEEIAASFKITTTIKHGVAANQPNPYAAHKSRTLTIAFAAIVLAIVVQLFFVIAYPAKPVRSSVISAAPTEPGPITLGPFTISGRTAAMELKTYAPLNNAWLDVDAELLNEDTEESYEFTQSLEQYSGYDSDGYWHEGNSNTSSLIAAVPAGSYLLLLQPASGQSGSNGPYTGPITVALYRNAHSVSAFLTVLAALCIYPILVFVRYRSFLKKQWENSEFTPYLSGASDDDSADDDSGDDA